MPKASKNVKSTTAMAECATATVAKPKVAKPKIKSLHCPTCKKLVLASNEDFPFCSDRCRRIDLGKWAMGVYRISSPALDPDLLEELEGHERDR